MIQTLCLYVSISLPFVWPLGDDDSLPGKAPRQNPGAPANKDVQDALAILAKLQAQQKAFQQYRDAQSDYRRLRDEYRAAQERDREASRRVSEEPDPAVRKKLQAELDRKRAADATTSLKAKEEVERSRRKAGEAFGHYRKVVESNSVLSKKEEDKARWEVLEKLHADAAARVKELEAQVAAAENDPNAAGTRRDGLKARLDEARRHEKSLASDLAALSGQKQ